MYPLRSLNFETPPYRFSGAVYGVLLNHQPALAALGDAVAAPPYGAPPKAPVLYIKPRNTLALHGEAVEVPADVPALQVGASLGIVIGRRARAVEVGEALAHVAGYVIVNDLCVPHGSFYRPQIHCRALDGFCPMGPGVTPRAAVASPDDLAVRVFIDGVCTQTTNTADRVRHAAQLIADVSTFMSLHTGDVLTLGISHGAPLARAGQHIAIEIAGLGRLETQLVGERS